MVLFKKSKFLQKIKESIPGFEKIKLLDCTYHAHTFSEWLEFEYGNYYYVFYHARHWGDEKLTYRKSYFDALAKQQRAPFEINDVLLKNKTSLLAEKD